MRTRVRKAFTLVEILIVVVILGILAAIVIPQFTNASEEAQTSAVQSQLQTLRNQIELFRVKTNGTYPDLLANQWSEMTPPAGAYLRSAPVNPRTGESLVADQEAPNVGWVWDAATNSITAAYFDELTGQWTGP